MKKYLFAILLATATLGTIYSCTETNEDEVYNEIPADSPDPDEYQRPGGGNG